MARLYSRATRTVAALMFSRSRVIKLSVVGIGLAIFAGQHLPRKRRDAAKDQKVDRHTDRKQDDPEPANSPMRQARGRDG